MRSGSFRDWIGVGIEVLTGGDKNIRKFGRKNSNFQFCNAKLLRRYFDRLPKVLLFSINLRAQIL